VLIRVILLTLLLTGCGLFSDKPSLDVAGDNAQIQQATGGSTASAETIEAVTTINEDGLDPWMWLLIGMLLPMPKFMKVIF
jgi:hypothetical protein